MAAIRFLESPMSNSAHGLKSRLLLTSGVVAALLTAGTALAADKAKPRAAALQAVVDCRKVTDPNQRLACYDAATGSLEAAEASGDVVVVDREQVREAQRSAFGFNFRLPGFMTGGGGGEAGGETKGSTSAELDTLETTVSEARLVNGKWVVRLPDGAIWNQTDNTFMPRPPKAGSKVVIKKAALGSYFMSLDGQRSVRAKREN
jgi:hypothetical protein